MTAEKTPTEREALTARVRADLESAGFMPVAPDDAGTEGGLRLSVFGFGDQSGRG